MCVHAIEISSGKNNIHCYKVPVPKQIHDKFGIFRANLLTALYSLPSFLLSFYHLFLHKFKRSLYNFSSDHRSSFDNAVFPSPILRLPFHTIWLLRIFGPTFLLFVLLLRLRVLPLLSYFDNSTLPLIHFSFNISPFLLFT